MSERTFKATSFAAGLLMALLIFSSAAQATIVRIETVLGDIDINLYDNATPGTVSNFLSYVQNGAYSDSIVHRTVPNFILQGGGFQTDASAQISPIASNPAVVNEPVYSNVRGTIAMAKSAGNPDSATNQWFININNNAANLDTQNGGFTVFGEVSGNGMDVVDAIAALPRFPFASPLDEIPLQDYTNDDFSNGVGVTNDNFIIVTGITVIDSTVDSAAGLNPTPTTASGGGNGGNGGGNTGGGGGGQIGLFGLLLLVWACRRRVMRFTC